MGQDLTDKTLLVFRTGGIGDLLFIQPNLRYLKSKYPTCKIIFACGPQYQPMVKNWSFVDEVIDLPFTLTQLREAHYHALFEGVIERCQEAHMVNAYILFTRWMGLNLPLEMLRPLQTPKEDKLDECMKLLEEWKLSDQKFIVTQLRASSPIRTPRPKIWAKLIDELTDKGINILITDNPRQSDFVDLFIKEAKNKDKIFNFCKHSKSIDYTIAITSLASLVITTDSALGHIAESVGTKGYGLYGPFPGEIRLTTYPGFKWVNAVKDCAPCFIHSPKPCPRASSDGFSPCYDNLDINQIVKDIEGMLK
jgi:ADP-heptose:LPS heptosyltransferase